MRELALSLLLCTGLVIPAAALAQGDPPASVDDFVCAFSGECPEETEAEEPADRPRLEATRGFAVSGPDARSSTRRPPQRRTNSAPGRRRAPQTAQSFAPAGPGRRVNLSLSFETGSANLTPVARAQAQVFAQSLLRPQLRNMRFMIEGHTDSVGGRAMNIDLSQRRAQTVADFLVAAGVGRDRLLVRGYGPDRPLPGLRGTASENRRVEAVRIS
jgi:outer membrane protein OmpA-like peptidoglycan-associated protein